jgi:hypothetical protein
VHPSASARHAPTWNQGASWNRFKGRAQSHGSTSV